MIGGIADYSGSLVLEMPIAEAATVAVQASGESGVTVVSLPDRPDGTARQVTISADDWRELVDGDYETARNRLRANPDESWAAYLIGPALVLAHETSARLPLGLRMLVDSRVPEGKGVSSSAAVEVAAMRAVAALAGHEIGGEEIARLCQVAENRVVGAPCGIMDQMTSAVGRQDQLLALCCVSRRRWKVTRTFRKASRFGALIRGFDTRFLGRTTHRFAPGRSWDIGLSRQRRASKLNRQAAAWRDRW